MIEYHSSITRSTILIYQCKNCNAELTNNPCNECGLDNINTKQKELMKTTNIPQHIPELPYTDRPDEITFHDDFAYYGHYEDGHEDR